MQDQAKRLLLAVGLALVVMVAWNQFFSPPPKPKTAATEVAPSKPAGDPSSWVGVPQSQAATGLNGRRVAAAEKVAEAPTFSLTFPNVVVQFSATNAALTSWKLTDPKYLNGPLLGEMIAEHGLLLTNFARSTFVIPPGTVWKGEQLSPTEVRFTYRSDNLEVVKTFTVHPDNYLVTLGVQVSTLASAAQQRLVITSYGYQDPKIEEGGRDQTRAFVSSTYANGELYTTPLKSLAKQPRGMASFSWTGFDHPYLLIAMAPSPATLQVEKFSTVTEQEGGIQTDVLFPSVAMRGGDQPLSYSMVTYVGPKYYGLLESADKIAGYPTNFNHSVDLGWFKIIGRPLLTLLQFLHGSVGNWGVAIILLTVLVKLATLYWTTKSMRSMKAMASLAPKMKELKEKYKDDSAKLQQETMALYKHHGVNPLAGCLPMFLQMPIWIALYRMLSSASELYLQPFIPGWIADLTARDPYYILPVALTATMFVQSRLQPAAVDSAQQKMMMYGMPLMFGAMGLFFPSGLTLYMFTNTVLSALHSVYMNKFDKVSLAHAAKLKMDEQLKAAVTEVGKAGKGAGKKATSADDAATDDEDLADDAADDDSDDTSPSRSKKKPVASGGKKKRKPRR